MFTRKLLEYGEVYFASVASLNDAYDCRPVIVVSDSDDLSERFEILAEKLLQYLSGKVDISSIPEDEMTRFKDRAADYLMSMVDDHGRLSESAMNRLTKHWGVLSLTDDPSSNTMWSYYGDANKGVCVGLDANSFPISHAVPVQYLDDVPTLALREVPLNDLITTFKTKSYSREREWRVVKREAGSVQMGSSSVREVIFGCNCTQDDIETTKTFLQSFGSRAKLLKVVRDSGRFGLEAMKMK